ncbi:MAG: sugar transferase [Chlorobi bacterium]|nr:sugar transferase [Chlorobiota bacterium]
MKTKQQTILYLVFDFLSSAIAWTLFFIFRKYYFEINKLGLQLSVIIDDKYFFGLAIIPVCWLLLYYITGQYKDVFRKSRLKEFGQTLLITIIGVLFIFFVLILDDTILNYKNYYTSFIVLLGLHFTLTYIPRFIITSRTIHKLRNRIIGFNTLIIGGNDKAIHIYNAFNNKPKSAGNIFCGFINVNGDSDFPLAKHIPHLGNVASLKSVIQEKKISEVIIAIESSEKNELEKIIGLLEETNVVIKAIPDLYDILTGTVKMSSIYGAPLIQISHQLMLAWQENLKRLIDVITSVIILTLFSPVYLILAIGVKLSSKGPVFYKHERIGRYGKPFIIYKFRSMIDGAEQNGPELSSKTDSRITKFGKFLRKMRLDELPQFYNVLIGDMSLVGPRPERKYYIDQIVKKAPHYIHLLKVRPGITSWGQVKFGYAENVDEMIERLNFDIIYIENMSLYVDFKILIYTVKTVLEASGK